ncbi:MAG: GAF domain-containing protein, partial [Planctomycetota bacterium]
MVKKNYFTQKFQKLEKALPQDSLEAQELLQALKQEVMELSEANEVLEGYNRSLSLKMVERTEELQNLLNTLQEEKAFQEAYNTLVTKLNSSVELDQLLKDALSGMLEFTDSLVGILYLFNKESQLLEAVQWKGVEPEKKAFALGEGLPGQAIQEKRFIHVTHPPHSAKFSIKGGIFDGWRGIYYAFQRMFAEI